MFFGFINLGGFMKEEFTTNARRWYDRDPVLSSAMKTLEESDDETQIKVALNLIKIITEHNISNSEYESVEDIISRLTDEMLKHAKNMEFEKAAELRDKIKELEKMID